MLIMLSGISQISLADGPCCQAKTECEEVLTECDKVVDIKNQVIEACDATIAKTGEMYKDTKVKFDESQSELQKIYRNPFVMVGLGITAGFVIDRVWGK